MYEYLDRYPPQLDLPARIGHMSLRLWAKDVRSDRCPMMTLRSLFSRFGVSGALWPVHNFYSWTFAHAARPITVGCPCCGVVADDEAMLLTAIMAEDSAQINACLRSLITEQALARAIPMARCVGQELRLAQWRDARTPPIIN
ncbi:MAG: hypothetical protein ABWZ40_13340 [Caulobacterales bacterium]